MDQNGQLDLPKSFLQNVVGVDTFDGLGHGSTKFNFASTASAAKALVVPPIPSIPTVVVSYNLWTLLATRETSALRLLMVGETVYIMSTDPGSNSSGTITKQ